MEKQIDKYTHAFRNIYKEIQIATTVQKIYIINKDGTSKNTY